MLKKKLKKEEAYTNLTFVIAKTRKINKYVRHLFLLYITTIELFKTILRKKPVAKNICQFLSLFSIPAKGRLINNSSSIHLPCS